VGQGLLTVEASRSHSDTPHSVGRVFSPSQRPLPDNIQHLQETDIHARLIGIETTIPKSEWPQNLALDRSAIGISICLITAINQTAHCNYVMEFNIPVILPKLIQIESFSLVS